MILFLLLLLILLVLLLLLSLVLSLLKKSLSPCVFFSRCNSATFVDTCSPRCFETRGISFSLVARFVNQFRLFVGRLLHTCVSTYTCETYMSSKMVLSASSSSFVLPSLSLFFFFFFFSLYFSLVSEFPWIEGSSTCMWCHLLTSCERDRCTETIMKIGTPRF